MAKYADNLEGGELLLDIGRAVLPPGFVGKPDWVAVLVMV